MMGCRCIKYGGVCENEVIMLYFTLHEVTSPIIYMGIIPSYLYIREGSARHTSDYMLGHINNWTTIMNMYIYIT